MSFAMPMLYKSSYQPQSAASVSCLCHGGAGGSQTRGCRRPSCESWASCLGSWMRTRSKPIRSSRPSATCAGTATRYTVCSCRLSHVVIHPRFVLEAVTISLRGFRFVLELELASAWLLELASFCHCIGWIHRMVACMGTPAELVVTHCAGYHHSVAGQVAGIRAEDQVVLRGASAHG